MSGGEKNNDSSDVGKDPDTAGGGDDHDLLDDGEIPDVSDEGDTPDVCKDEDPNVRRNNAANDERPDYLIVKPKSPEVVDRSCCRTSPRTFRIAFRTTSGQQKTTTTIIVDDAKRTSGSERPQLKHLTDVVGEARHRSILSFDGLFDSLRRIRSINCLSSSFPMTCRPVYSSIYFQTR